MSQKLKVAVVIPKYGKLGGAEAFAYETSRRLAVRDDLEIHVLAEKFYATKGKEIFHKIPSSISPRTLKPLFFACMVWREANKNTFDILHSHDRILQMDLLTMHGLAHLSWVREIRRKRPSVFDRVQAMVERKGLSKQGPPILMCVSSLVQENILKVYPHLAERSIILHPGVEVERFQHPEKDEFRRQIRSSYNISLSDNVVLFVGMNFEIKGLDVVLKGVSELVKRESAGSFLKVLVVGKGDQRRYKRMAYELGIGERVYFAGTQSEVERYYSAGDIFVMPSVLDTFGIAVLEAMAAGIPPVITETVGAKDIVSKGKCGFILPRKPDGSAMADAIRALLDPERRRFIGEAALQEAKRHSWEKVAEQIQEIYRLIMIENRKNRLPL